MCKSLKISFPNTDNERKVNLLRDSEVTVSADEEDNILLNIITK